MSRTKQIRYVSAVMRTRHPGYRRTWVSQNLFTNDVDLLLWEEKFFFETDIECVTGRLRFIEKCANLDICIYTRIRKRHTDMFVVLFVHLNRLRKIKQEDKRRKYCFQKLFATQSTNVQTSTLATMKSSVDDKRTLLNVLLGQVRPW